MAPTGQELPVAMPAQPALDLESVVRRLNDSLAERQRNLSFHIDESSGRTVITVLDGNTQQVVRQIPAEEVLAFARAVEEAGVLVDARV
jgi:flagellar protein FlaG